MCDVDDNKTVRAQRRELIRRERIILWLGAGLIGLIGLMAGDVSAGIFAAQHVLRAIVMTAIVVAGASLAYARINFEWAVTQIERKIQDNEVNEADKLNNLNPKKLRKWPNGAEGAYYLGLVAIIFAGLTFVISAWVAQ